MTLYALIVYAFLSSTGVGDSERMAAQMNQPTLTLASDGQISAPTCVEFCGKEPTYE